MQIKSFTYTKSSGVQSQRVIIVAQEATNLTSGYDVSNLSEEDQVLLAIELERIASTRWAEIQAVLLKYDASNSYRQFDPLKMTNVSNETI